MLWVWDDLSECVVGQFLFGFMTLPIWLQSKHPTVLWLRWPHRHKALCHPGVGLPCQLKGGQIGPQTVWRALLVGSTSSVPVLPPRSLCVRWRMRSQPHSSSGVRGKQCFQGLIGRTRQAPLPSQHPSSLSSCSLCSKKPYPFQGSTLEVKFH